MSAPRLPVAEPPAAVKNHLLALTGLRLLPALAVYLYHVHAPAGSPDWLARGFGLGFGGVTVFFVLSGFVLAINYWDALLRPTRRALRRYAVARFARIYPLYLLVLGYVYMHTRITTGVRLPAWPWELVALQAWLPHVLDVWPWGPSWSISVELFLYACLPLLVLVLRPLRRVWHLLAAMAVAAAALLALAWWFRATGRASLIWVDPSSDHRWLYRMPLTRLFDFVLGIVGARLFVTLRGRDRAPLLGSALTVVTLVAMALLLTRPWVWNTPYRWDAAWAIPASGLILGLALAPRNALARILATAPVVLLGEASYAFYLIQISVAKGFGAGSWTVAASPMRIALELVALGMTLALSVGLHIGVERPARVFLRRLLGGRAPAAVAAPAAERVQAEPVPAGD